MDLQNLFSEEGEWVAEVAPIVVVEEEHKPSLVGRIMGDAPPKGETIVQEVIGDLNHVGHVIKDTTTNACKAVGDQFGHHHEKSFVEMHKGTEPEPIMEKDPEHIVGIDAVFT